MSERVSATEAARRLPDLLDRVRADGTTFVIVRDDEEIGQLAPAHPRHSPTLRDVVALLERLGSPDPAFAGDLAEIRAAQPPIGDLPWPS